MGETIFDDNLTTALSGLLATSVPPTFENREGTRIWHTRYVVGQTARYIRYFHYPVVALALCRLCITRPMRHAHPEPGQPMGLYIAEEVVYMRHLLSQSTALEITPSNKEGARGFLEMTAEQIPSG